MTVPKAALTFADTDKMVLGPVRAAWPVAAVNVGAAGATSNWLFGRGTPLGVCGGTHMWTDNGPQSKFIRCYGRIDDNHPALGFGIVLATDARLRLLTVTITLPDASTVVAYVNEIPTLYEYAIEIGIDLTSSPDIQLEWDGDYCGLVVHNVYVYECPIIRLQSETGTVGIVPRQQIFDGYDGDHLSIAGLARAVEQHRADYFRRGALYNWNSPSGEPLVIVGLTEETAYAYQALHPNGILPAVQTRLMYAGETTRTCKWNVHATITGNGGSVRITMANGDVSTFVLTGDTSGWQDVPLDIEVSTDDPDRWSIDGGLRGGVRDTVTLEAKREDVGGTIAISAITIYDPAG